MDLEELKFIEFLRHTGQKVTGSRRKILEEVYRRHDHFDAEELYLRLKERKSGVSRATVYRTLNLLTSCGLVRKMELGESRSMYEHVLGHPHHDHLVCISCGKIYEFNHPLIEEMQKDICRQHDFEMLTHNQQIYGRCRACRDTGTRDT